MSLRIWDPGWYNAYHEIPYWSLARDVRFFSAISLLAREERSVAARELQASKARSEAVETELKASEDLAQKEQPCLALSRACIYEMTPLIIAV